MSRPNSLARKLFAGIAPGYDRWAEVFSLFQYRRWHAALVAALDPQPGERVLDVCTGTGAVAFDLAAHRCIVVGLDLSREMLREADRRRAHRSVGGSAWTGGVELVEGRAEDLPFPTAAFDVVTFTFLLRYVADPAQPVREIARVLRGGGRAAMLEFAVPAFPVTRSLWQFYAYAALPLATALVSPGWATVGAFLGRSITDFYRLCPLPDLVSAWECAGFGNVRCQYLSLGGAIIVTGERK